MTPPTDEARADYLPMPECDHAQDCICVEPDHAYCCGTARAAVLDSMTDEARAGEPRPSTEAGRYLLTMIHDWRNDESCKCRDFILAIEREAAAMHDRFDRSWWHYADDCPVAAAPALDVERLTEAIDEHAGQCEYDACFGVCAKPIAAEYARLSEKSDDVGIYGQRGEHL